MRYGFSHLTLIAVMTVVSGYGCGEIESAPTLGATEAAQISGGLGFTVYHFHIEGQRVGALLVTDGAEGGAYADQTEYWRFDRRALKDLADDAIEQLDVVVAKHSAAWSTASVRRHFEQGTASWVDWMVPRMFELAAHSTRARTDEGQRRTMFRMSAAGGGPGGGEISYTLMLDFDQGLAPRTTWLIDAEELVGFYPEHHAAKGAPKGLLSLPRGIDPYNWEVEMGIDRPLERVEAAHGFEMTPLAD